MKLALQITLGVLSLIPLFFGITGLLWGTTQFMPTEQVIPELDNQFRYWSGFYFLLALLLWWMIPNIEQHTTPLRLVCAALVIGGLGRLISCLNFGTNDPGQLGAMVLEIGSIAIVFWQSRLQPTGDPA